MSAHDEDDRELSAKIDALPREIEPGRDLWKGIDARIQAKPRVRPVWQSPQLQMAALFFLCIGASAYVLHGRNQPGPAEQAPIASVAPAPPVSAPTTAPKSLVPEEDNYRQALAVLTPTYLQRRAQLPVADAAKVEASLRAIETARAATRAALAEHPDDGDLSSELDAEYEQESQTMNDVLDWTTRS